MQEALEAVLPRDLAIFAHAYAIGDFDYLDTSLNFRVIRLLDTISYSAYNCTLWHACYRGDIDMVRWLIERDEEILDWDTGFRGACIMGRTEIVRLILTDYNADIDRNKMMRTVCERGHADVARLLVEHEPTAYPHPDSYDGLVGACEGGHIEIAEMMLEHRARPNGGLPGACRRGDVDLIRLLIENGANDWNGGLEAACEHGHLHIVRLMIEHGATRCWFCDEAMAEQMAKT